LQRLRGVRSTIPLECYLPLLILSPNKRRI
jgi:hypothetical protein